jgi:hypothetical protein
VIVLGGSSFAAIQDVNHGSTRSLKARSDKLAAEDATQARTVMGLQDRVRPV